MVDLFWLMISVVFRVNCVYVFRIGEVDLISKDMVLKIISYSVTKNERIEEFYDLTKIREVN